MDMLTPTQQPDRMQAAAWFLVGQIHAGSSGGDVQHIPLNVSPFTVGRRPDACLSLPLPTVSTNHAEIVSEDGALTLRDLGSTNGTYLNGARLEGEAPLQQDDLIQFADVALRVQRQAPQACNATLQEDVYDQALALTQFDKLMSERQVVPYYQPIVSLATQETIGYEVLGRSRLYGLTTPAAMFKAAAKLNLEVQLSHMLRWEGVLQSDAFTDVPHLLVNTHPAEMQDTRLVGALQALRKIRPEQPLTLEIHEASVTSVPRMTELKAILRELDIKLAYDDFGAGQARLVELVKVQPDYLKFDIALVRDLDQAPTQHQQVVASLVKMVRELGVTPLAEGIERFEESDICRQLGFELGQGYLFGKPAPATCF